MLHPALAREVRLDPDGTTGNRPDAMIPQAADWEARVITWRYASDPAQPGATAPL